MKILVVSAHPDDETLGAGGTLARHIEAGDEVSWLITTAPHPDDWSQETITACDGQVTAVRQAYGFKALYDLRFPAARLEQVPKRPLIDGVMDALAQARPDRIYTVGGTDVHSDHLITFEALMLAAKPFRRDPPIGGIYAYEVLSSTEGAYGWRERPFVPNVYRDITGFLNRKAEIMALYGNQLQDDLQPRSQSAIRALARYRGATIGVESAEAFTAIREIL
jgi:LmbE family N-acetylglucosaminyl deacetylase